MLDSDGSTISLNASPFRPLQAIAAVRTDFPAVPPGYGQALLAFAEARFLSCSDTGPKAIAYRRSLDAGKTWSQTQLLVADDRKTVKDGLNLGATVVLPPVRPGAPDRILVFYCECAHACDVAPTLLLQSDDAGVTFLQPRNITDALLAGGVGMWAPGPDHGTLLRPLPVGRLLLPVDIVAPLAASRSGHVPSSPTMSPPPPPPPPAGRIVVCGQARPPKVGESQGTVCILSDDMGGSFRVGGRLNRTSEHWWNECLPVQLGNGSVLLSVRDEVADTRGFAVSEDGGESFSDAWNRVDLPDPHCQGSLVRLRETGVLVLSNDRSSTARVNLALTLSVDEGSTWRKQKPVWTGPSAYSSLAVLFDTKKPAHGANSAVRRFGGSSKSAQGANVSGQAAAGPVPTVALLFERGVTSPYEKISFTLAVID